MTINYRDYEFDPQKMNLPYNTSVIIPINLELIMSEERKMYPMKCADCGTDSEVPFEPKPDRPVYCKECLPKHRSKRF